MLGRRRRSRGGCLPPVCCLLAPPPQFLRARRDTSRHQTGFLTPLIMLPETLRNALVAERNTQGEPAKHKQLT